MGVEIERKFLTRNDAWKTDLLQTLVITQGYLSSEPNTTIRVRLTKQGEAAYGHITIKTPRIENVCSEFEYMIPAEDAEALLVLCSCIIQKNRYVRFDQYEQKWEIDEFTGGLNDGLVVAEFEMTDKDQPIEYPGWIGQEVSDDYRYTNVYLASNKVG